MFKRKLLRLAILALAASGFVALQGSAAQAAFIEKAEWLKLDNGLQVVLIPQGSTPLVASTVIVRAGSRHESHGLAGATHFLEHLLFNGTTRRTQKELYDAIDRIGAYNNASTRADITIFQLLVHRNKLAEGLDIQADMLFNSTLPEDKFEKERGIVIEEIGQTFDLPRTVANRFFTETLFAGTPYSRPVLGSPSSIKRLSRKAVMDYYKTFYQPSNMTLVLMGGVARDEVLPLVKATFGQAHERPTPTRKSVDGLSLSGRRVVGRRAEAKRTYLNLTFGAPQITDPKYPAFATLATLLNAGSSSRLERLFKMEGSPAVYSIGAAVLPAHEAPAFSISATLPPDGDGPVVLQMLLDELEGIARGNITSEEIDQAALEAQAEDAFLSENILYYAFFQSPYFAAAPPEWLRSFPSRLQRVTRADVAAAAKSAFANRPFLATLYGPKVPEGEHPWDALAPKGILATESPTATAPKKPAPAITNRKLENGLTVIVKEVPDTKVFALHLLARDRALWEPDNKTGIAELMHRLLPEGTSHRSAEQVSRDLASIGARLKVTDNQAIPYDNYYHSPEFSYIRFEVMDALALEGLAQLADVVLHPRFDEDAVERIKSQHIDDIKRAKERARVRAGRLFSKTLFGDHPRGRPVLGTDSKVESITTEDLRAFHSAYFAPGNLIITVVSPRPAEKVIGWLTFYFGQKTEGPASPPTWPALKPSPKARTATQRAGKAQSYLYIGQLIDLPKDAEEAAEAMNAILSDRLGFELRERRGLAYSIGSSIVQTQVGWYFVAGLGTQEANLEEAKEGIFDAIRALQTEPPGEAELKKTVNGLIGAAYRRRLTGISQAYFLAMEAFRGNPPGREGEWAERIHRVSPEDAMRAAKLLQPEKMVVVTVR